MNDETASRTVLFLDNCRAMREAYRFTDKFTLYLAAARLASKGVAAAPGELKSLHAEMKENVRFLSPLRDIEPAVISPDAGQTSIRVILPCPGSYVKYESRKTFGRNWSPPRRGFSGKAGKL